MKIIILTIAIFLPAFMPAQPTMATIAKMTAADCLEKLALVDYEPVNAQYQLLKKRPIKDIARSVATCGFSYQYSSGIKDRSCSMLLPVWLDGYSVSVGNDHFLISFEAGDSLGDCIVLAYNFLCQESGYSNSLNTGSDYDSVIDRNLKIYTYRNEQGMYVGERALSDQMTLYYYTKSRDSTEQLHNCLLSFQFQ